LLFALFLKRGAVTYDAVGKPGFGAISNRPPAIKQRFVEGHVTELSAFFPGFALDIKIHYV